MAITTYAELKAAMIKWLNGEQYVQMVPDFIALCEADLNRRLRVRRNIGRSTSTLEADAEFLAVPSNFAGARRVRLSNDDALEWTSPERMVDLKDLDNPERGNPQLYTVVGGELEFWPSPTDDVTVYMTYYKTLTALASDDDTNWLLTAYPDIYLYGSLAQTPTDERVADWSARYEAALRALNAAELSENTGGRLRVEAVATP